MTFVAQKAVHFEGMVGIGPMQGRQRVVFDPLFLQGVQPAQNLVEGGLLAFVDAIDVVQRLRDIDADPNQKIVLLQKPCPAVIDQRAVGLQRIDHTGVGLAIFFDQFDRAFKKGQPHQRRLAPLPGHLHLRCRVALDQLAKIGIEQFIRHPETTPRIEHFFGEEKTVGAVEVAEGACRFDQHMKSRWSGQHGRFLAAGSTGDRRPTCFGAFFGVLGREVCKPFNERWLGMGVRSNLSHRLSAGS